MLKMMIVLREHAGTAATGLRKNAVLGGVGLVARLVAMIVPLT